MTPSLAAPLATKKEPSPPAEDLHRDQLDPAQVVALLVLNGQLLTAARDHHGELGAAPADHYLRGLPRTSCGGHLISVEGRHLVDRDPAAGSPWLPERRNLRARMHAQNTKPLRKTQLQAQLVDSIRRFSA